MTGTERKRAWRERQKAARYQMVDFAPKNDEPQGRSTFVVDYPAARASILKSIRAEIRLKHSLAADLELATTTPKIVKILNAYGVRAMLPTLDAVKRHLAGKPLPGVR